ncbi:MAG: hypothetical protein RB148_09065 [Armatimonadota bacterium]|nr:hypothetical protein [Armatimonadota bacterium]
MVEVHLFFFRVDEEGRLVPDDEAKKILRPGQDYLGTVDEEGRLTMVPVEIRPLSEAFDDEEDWSDLPEGEAPAE